MPFEGEYAAYEPLKRLLLNDRINDSLKTLSVKKKDILISSIKEKLINTSNSCSSTDLPKFIISIDGSYHSVPVTNGYPSAECGIITVSAVILDFEKLKKLSNSEKFPDPREVKSLERASSIDIFIPGCNVTLNENEKFDYGDLSVRDNPLSFLRYSLYKSLSSQPKFEDEQGETLLETYEYLLKSRNTATLTVKNPYSEEELLPGELAEQGGFINIDGNILYSTDFLRIHELYNPLGSCGEMYGQIMSCIEKLYLVNILRNFEKQGLLGIGDKIAFFLDGPLAVFSTPSWLARVIKKELNRINEVQKIITKKDLLILGIEKTGSFVNHFSFLDTNASGNEGKILNQTLMLLDDKYIKENIELTTSPKQYGQDTFFGRKFFYKTKNGQRIVAVDVCYTDEQQNLETANKDQYVRLNDVLSILDSTVSNRYPNALIPLVVAHKEAAIPFKIGRKLFTELIKELKV
ncbi:DNA double-strand break repair nuclease NurA [Succinivibrio dextrinosolvens]|uniref:DNA double-strand break repair nuclease NurA n=1 Tax=Succinivibrio dextrinosolvens TaxID=83771 RepID=UPI00192099FE|nr:DNA double-strand break repair nuclease NurA [Succinivibrio dextrinosolvens]